MSNKRVSKSTSPRKKKKSTTQTISKSKTVPIELISRTTNILKLGSSHCDVILYDIHKIEHKFLGIDIKRKVFARIYAKVLVNCPTKKQVYTNVVITNREILDRIEKRLDWWSYSGGKYGKYGKKPPFEIKWDSSQSYAMTHSGRIRVGGGGRTFYSANVSDTDVNVNKILKQLKKQLKKEQTPKPKPIKAYFFFDEKGNEIDMTAGITDIKTKKQADDMKKYLEKMYEEKVKTIEASSIDEAYKKAKPKSKIIKEPVYPDSPDEDFDDSYLFKE